MTVQLGSTSLFTNPIGAQASERLVQYLRQGSAVRGLDLLVHGPMPKIATRMRVLRLGVGRN